MSNNQFMETMVRYMEVEDLKLLAKLVVDELAKRVPNFKDAPKASAPTPIPWPDPVYRVSLPEPEKIEPKPITDIAWPKVVKEPTEGWTAHRARGCTVLHTDERCPTFDPVIRNSGCACEGELKCLYHIGKGLLGIIETGLNVGRGL